MRADPVIDEIRKVRDEHAKECAYDVHRAFEQMRAEPESRSRGARRWREAQPRANGASQDSRVASG